MPKISLYALFLLVMALDLLFGTFKENPMSFLYSFTFLGIFITQGHSSRLQLFLNILSANLILSFVTNSPITPWGIFWGLILTPIFSLAFPLLFVCVAAPILSFPTEFLINSWFKILSLIPAPEFYFTASLPLITAFFFLRKLPKIAIIFLLFIHSEGLFNEKKTKSYGSERPLPLHVVSKQVRIKSGYRSDSKLWRIRCYSKMQGSEWRVRCSDLPAKQLVRK